VDVSIRPGWFYHPEEDAKVKSAAELMKIYLESAGRGANLILNVPPDRRGLIHGEDSATLVAFGKALRNLNANNVALGKQAILIENEKTLSAKSITDGDRTTFTTSSVLEPSFEIDLGEVKEIDHVQLMESIELGQRVYAFIVDYWDGAGFRALVSGTTVGYKRILSFRKVKTSKIRINILKSKAEPVIAEVGVY
jgi:alpha-L-fucosidase